MSALSQEDIHNALRTVMDPVSGKGPRLRGPDLPDW